MPAPKNPPPRPTGELVREDYGIVSFFKKHFGKKDKNECCDNPRREIWAGRNQNSHHLVRPKPPKAPDDVTSHVPKLSQEEMRRKAWNKRNYPYYDDGKTGNPCGEEKGYDPAEHCGACEALKGAKGIFPEVWRGNLEPLPEPTKSPPIKRLTSHSYMLEGEIAGPKRPNVSYQTPKEGLALRGYYVRRGKRYRTKYGKYSKYVNEAASYTIEKAQTIVANEKGTKITWYESIMTFIDLPENKEDIIQKKENI